MSINYGSKNQPVRVGREADSPAPRAFFSDRPVVARRDNRLLTTTDVARLLVLSVDGVRWLARLHRIPCERTCSGQYLFREADVERVLVARAKARTGLVVVQPRPRVGNGEPRQLTLLPLLLERPLRLVGRRTLY